MKLKLSTSLLFLMFVFSITSCKNEKKEQVGTDGQEANDIELLADVKYQCPMECEDGKTYREPGSCPVCKMDLQPLESSDEITCTLHKDGNCTCEGDACSCANCPEHTKTMTCSAHENGECKCEGDKCSCANCPEHT